MPLALTVYYFGSDSLSEHISTPLSVLTTLSICLRNCFEEYGPSDFETAFQFLLDFLQDQKETVSL